MEMPLFPLHAVLVPGAPLKVHVFEDRYRALVSDCLAAGISFGVACITAGREVGAGPVRFAAVGTLAEIREVTRHPDGRFELVTIGTDRFRLSGLVADGRPYLVGTGDLLPELVGDPGHVARVAVSVRARFVRYLELLQPDLPDDVVADVVRDGGVPDDERAEQPDPAPGEDDPAPAAPERVGAILARLEEIAALLAPRDDPTMLSHVVSGLLQVELPRRQHLLEAATTEDRLVELDGLLAREAAFLARGLAPYPVDLGIATARRN